MSSIKLKIAAIVAVALFGMAAIIFALVTSSPSGGKRIQRLTNGSTLEIRQVTLSNGFQYKHQGGNRLMRLVVPILPGFIRNRLPLPSFSAGFSGDGNTNLFIVTVNRASHTVLGAGYSGLERLVVSDDQGNSYDACRGAGRLGWPGEAVDVWQIRAFPRRSRMLGLRFLSEGSNKRWEVAAEFQTGNPAYRNYPQWSPEPWPATRKDDDLAVTLKEFESGGAFNFGGIAGDGNTVCKRTRAVFTFSQNGRPVDDWSIQKLTIEDATGNRFSPYLARHSEGLSWTTNGTVELFGALWPGENAWKLDLEFVRTAGFSADELWESPAITIPAVGVATNLDASFRRDNVMVTLVGLASPRTDHPEPFKWIAKYSGNEDKDNIISLAVRIAPAPGKRRLKLLRAVDQNGHEARLVEHRNEDYGDQAFLLRPDDEAISLKLTFALQRSRFVQFLVRPRFVGAEATGQRGQ